MKTLTKIIGIGALALALAGCGLTPTVEQPYRPASISELKQSEGKKVVVEGVPSLIREDGFVLKNDNTEVYVTRNIYKANVHSTGDYSAGKEALIRDEKEGKKIKVYGISAQDKTIEARFIDVDGSLYEIYK